jgi:hypothetical protein
LKNVYKNHTVDRIVCNNIHISRKQADKETTKMRNANYDPNFNPLAGVTVWHFGAFLAICIVVGVICAMASEAN